ncbi:hypothetical protein P7L70_00555 (plasmid) [Tistrella mobilis]|uniref:hypothetical protein n=1 Tax=Tistrella mobilis TaxID=171437 RepID=UPI003557DE4E
MALTVSPDQLPDPVNDPGGFWNAVNGHLNAPGYFPPESVSVTAASATLVRLDFDLTVSLATDYVVDPETGTLSNAVGFGRIWIVQRGYVWYDFASGDEISRVVAAATSVDPAVAGRDAADGASPVTYHLDASSLTTGSIRETIPNNGINPDDTSPTIAKTTTWYDDYVLLVEASPVAGAGADARFLISDDDAAAERSLNGVWGAWLDGTAPFTQPTQTFGAYDAPAGWQVDENIYGDVFGIKGGATLANGMISEDAPLVRQKLAYALREIGATSLENLLVGRGLTEAESLAWRESIETDQEIVDALAGISNAVFDKAVALVGALTDGVTSQETIDQLMQQIVADHAAAVAAAEAAITAHLDDPAFDGNVIPDGMSEAGLHGLIVKELLQATFRLMAYDDDAHYLYITANPGIHANRLWNPQDLARDAHGLVIGGAGMDQISGSSGIDLLIGGAGDDRISGRGGDDRLAGGIGADRLDGGEGFDTATYSDSSAGVVISLATGTTRGGDAEGDVLVSIEAVEGSAFDDRLLADHQANTLIGGKGDDVLVGRGGADRLEGGEGFDTASYSDSHYGVVVSLLTGATQYGDAQGDVLISIEALEGSRRADRLAGDAGVNTLSGLGGDDILRGRGGADRLDGGEGFDTATYSDSSAGVVISLATGTTRGGDAEGDVLVSIEAVEGSAFDDRLLADHQANTLIGGKGDDALVGRGGADRLDGGAGFDTASYSDSHYGVVVSLLTGATQYGDAQGDVLIGIEALEGSEKADRLAGDAGVNTLSGLGGDDILRGRGGADRLDGGQGFDIATYSDSGAGVIVDLASGIASGGDAEGDVLVAIEAVEGSAFNDVLLGGEDANTLLGGSGDDILRGRGGADRLDGGNGFDTVSYSDSSAGVTVSLATGTTRGGDAEGDVLASIEAIEGSDFADRLLGDENANTLIGGGGNDVLQGRGHADRLDGGEGYDTVSYSDSYYGVVVSLLTGTTQYGDAQGDVLINIEAIEGSAKADRLAGDAGTNTLSGLGGDDILRGRGGADRLDGGSGFDTVTYSDSSAGVTVDLATGTAHGGDAQGDILEGIEAIEGSAYSDQLSGDDGINHLSGLAGNDELRGLGGADVLTGGRGADRFVYDSVNDSGITIATRDLITDFSQTDGDRIDLSGLDANTGRSGKQDFVFIGDAAFSGEAGELRAVRSTDTTTIYADVDGDGQADLSILLSGSISVTAADFVF